MFVIANNISTRYPNIDEIFQQLKENDWQIYGEPAKNLQNIVKECVTAGADALEINLQQRYDRPEAMLAAVNIIQQVTDRPLCLSSHRAETLHTGIDICKTPPIVNYVSVDETELREILPVIAQHRAQVVLLVSDPSRLTDAQEMLDKAVILIGAANEVGITIERIFVDPGLVHINSDLGLRHLTAVKHFLRASGDTLPAAVKTTCWISNISSGVPIRLRNDIEVTLLPMLAGLGLHSVFLNILERKNMRTVRLINIFNNELVYADSLVAD
jgi:cobalamin-dependent methionine synthase I